MLRFDSLSKILSSGLRIGWVTGPSDLVGRINLHEQVRRNTSGLPNADRLQIGYIENSVGSFVSRVLVG